MDLLLKVKDVPDGATVYKKTGETPYTIVDKLTIYTYDTAKGGKGSSGERQVVMEKGVRYLVGETGNINAVTEESIVRMKLTKITVIDDEEYSEELDLELLERIIEKHTGCDYVRIDAEVSQ